MPPQKKMTPVQVTREVERVFEVVTNSTCYHKDQPPSVTRDYLEQLQTSIQIELEHLPKDD